MNLQKMSRVRSNVQAGFTLIELIVVIVILGILAATALPKFADLGADARSATVRAARGSIESASAMVHGKWLVNSALPVVLEGTTVPTSFGYPTAVAATFTAAGLKPEDYVSYTAVSGTFTPAITSGSEIVAIPKSVDGTTKGATCYVKYIQAVDATTPARTVIDVAGC